MGLQISLGFQQQLLFLVVPLPLAFILLHYIILPIPARNRNPHMSREPPTRLPYVVRKGYVIIVMRNGALLIAAKGAYSCS